MPYLKVYIHLLWSTKNRESFLTKGVRQVVFNHIRENCKKKSIRLITVNGYTDHAHTLISLGKDQTISKLAQLVKGESSFWINSNHIIKHKFEWQDEYYAASVGESELEKIKKYIDNQEEHHKHESFEEEYKKLMDEFGFLSLG